MIKLELLKDIDMLYAVKDNQGNILAISQYEQTGSVPVDVSDPDVMEFLNNQNKIHSPEQYLNNSDGNIGRILEDLIELLISQNTIRFTDLPEEAQQKLMNRKLARSARSLLMGDDPNKTNNNSILLDDDTL